MVLFFYPAFLDAIHVPRGPVENLPLTQLPTAEETTFLSNNELKSRATPKKFNFTLKKTPECIYDTFFLLQKDTFFDSEILETNYTDRELLECAVGPWQKPFDPPLKDREEKELNETIISGDCFCNLPAPLKSFWLLCHGGPLIDAEDWVDETCPERKEEFGTLDFKPIPACAKDCLHQQIMESDCVSERRDCFCFWGQLFGCELACGKKDTDTLREWHNKTCKGIEKPELSPGSDSHSERDKKAQLHRNLKSFAKYEIFSITIISISLAVLLGFMVFEIFVNDTVWFKEHLEKRDKKA